MMLTEYSLVVVDMQACFTASQGSSVIAGVAREIIFARQKKNPILFVEYADLYDVAHPTLEGLTALVKGYPHKARVFKHTDDGSTEVLKALRRRNFNMRRLRVCGVNTDCCVWSTVEGILSKTTNTKVEVAKGACATYLYKKYDWRWYMKHPRLKLVS